MTTNEHYRTHLETLRTTLITDLRAIATEDPTTGDWQAMPPTDAGEADENIVADAAEEWQERRATVAVLETRYRNVVRALNKIANGTYGLCEISHEPIEPERLAANPAARTCAAHREQEAELPL